MLDKASPVEARSMDLAKLLKPYWRSIAGLVLLTLFVNALYLVVPKLIAWAIDTYTAGHFRLDLLAMAFGGVSVGIFFFACFTSFVQTYTSALVARDLRNRLVDKISGQDYVYVQKVGAAKLLTNLTSDI